MLYSIFTMKCPRCRRGPMFLHANPWNLRSGTKMPERCPVCRQRFELEVGFWYGTGYVSYLLTVLFSMLTFVLWWLTIGFSLHDDRFFWWLGINSAVMLILLPWFIRLSRVVYIYFFVRFDPDHDKKDPGNFDYSTDAYFVKKEGQ